MSESRVPIVNHPQHPEIMEQLEAWRNPIVDKTVSGLGDAELQNIRLTGGQSPQRPLRVHRAYSVELDDHRHGVEITSPVDRQADFAVFSYPGFTEHGKGGIRRKMHSHLSYIFPEATIISVDSNGIGTTGDRYDYRGRHNHGLEAMGQQRLDLAQALAGRVPLFIQGTSMGSVISHRAAQANLERPVAERVDLRGLMWLSPALVDPSRIVKDMAIRFPVELGIDITKELAYKTSPLALLGLGRLAYRHDFRPADLPAMAHQVSELLKGTPKADVEAVVSRIPTVIVSGERDSLTQAEMFYELQEEYPGMVKLELIKGRGHGLAMKPGAACDKLQKVARRLVDETMPNPPSLSAA